MAPPARRWGSFPTTADEGIWAEADSPEGLFEALGLGLFALITDLDTVEPRESREIRAEGRDAPALAVQYLGALLLLQQTEGFLARELRVELDGEPPHALHAVLRGEPMDAARHPRWKEVKAITYHEIQVDPARGTARVIVDI
jgi:SHS2 domain-containing protein